MRVNYSKFVEGARRGICTALVAAVPFVFGACSTQESVDNSETAIVITNEDNEREIYEYVLYKPLTASEEVRNSESPVKFIKVVDEEIWSNQFEDCAFSSLVYDDSEHLLRFYFTGVWPECYSEYRAADFDASNSEITWSRKELKDTDGVAYTLSTFTISIKEDIAPTSRGLYVGNAGGDPSTKKLVAGDQMIVQLLTSGKYLLAYTQQGAGSECDNVKESLYGQGALKTVEEIESHINSSEGWDTEDIKNAEIELGVEFLNPANENSGGLVYKK